MSALLGDSGINKILIGPDETKLFLKREIEEE
jgi:hypothetical protein